MAIYHKSFKTKSLFKVHHNIQLFFDRNIWQAAHTRHDLKGCQVDCILVFVLQPFYKNWMCIDVWHFYLEYYFKHLNDAYIVVFLEKKRKLEINIWDNWNLLKLLLYIGFDCSKKYLLIIILDLLNKQDLFNIQDIVSNKQK